MKDTNGQSNGKSNGSSNGASKGHSSRPSRPLKCGIWAPVMTFFNDDETLDLANQKRHTIRLAKAGVAGLVAMGSNGEAVHLSSSERIAVIRATREALDEAGFEQIPIMVGASEGSVRGTVALIKESAAAGGDYILLLAASYFRGLMTEEAIYAYFIAVADESPLPIIIYNYPGAVAGIDLDSDVLIKLAEHPNIIGTKFTCGNTGKLTRVALATDATTPFSEGSGYFAFGGMCDFTAQTLVSGGSGIIAGGANVMPKVCVQVWDLYVKGRMKESFELQKKLSKCDWVLTKAAIAGTKSAIQSYYGYGGHPRRPLRRLDEVGVRSIADGVEEVMAIEAKLPDVGGE